ncbi:hypothetical protein WOLCODRAFT_19149 [Wolfiporia cocos MD-104 SS10]|uniref:Uncharacterized protein n=1 Tax=Wolfiporia cocos (strain MD-104) TaxID=742152 RepID=A0A2H3K8J6_WOLCO|nr:hypothetical protein WOLCODRAFT_19149 [Wolfiporia cocos MD-104 SS10]
MASVLLDSVVSSLRNLRTNGFVSRTRMFRLLCIIAHLILVSLHIVALVIWCLQIELDAIYPVNDSGIMSDTIVLSMQAFVTLDSCPRHRILMEWTWSRNPWSLETMGRPIFCGWDIFAPRQTFPVPMLNVTSALVYNQSEVNAGNAFGFWDDAVELLPYFERVDYTSTIGLCSANLYGIILPNNCSGYVDTTGAAANVSCGLLQNVTIDSPAAVSNDTSGLDWIQPNITTTTTEAFYNSIIAENNCRVAGSLSLVPYNNISQYDTQAQYQQDGPQLPGRNVIFMLATNTSSSDMQAQNNSTSINGCSLDWVQYIWSVDVQTSLLSPQNPILEFLPDNPLTSWQAWEPLQIYNYDWVTQMQNEFFSLVYMETFIMLRGYITLRQMLYLGDTLSLLKNSISVSSVSQFEADLANLTAIMYWSVMYLPPKSAQNASWNMTDLSFYVLSQKNFTSLAYGSSSIATRLHLNIIQISIGLGASTTLFLLAIHLTRFDGNIAPVTSLGVLQLLWLTDRQPSLSGDLGSIDNPTIENLRSAGAALQFDIMSKQSAVDGTTYETVVMDDQSALL